MNGTSFLFDGIKDIFGGLHACDIFYDMWVGYAEGHFVQLFIL